VVKGTKGNTAHANHRPLPELPTDQIAVCDGAMGTMLHSAGVPIDQSLSELNVTQPRLVRDLHSAYIAAGARMVQTNTFDGNRLRLARVGLEDRVLEINIAGARLAREATQDRDPPVLVAGSVGPATSTTLVPRIAPVDRAGILREQIAALANWVDVIMLETFGDVESLVQAVDCALTECDLPIIAQMTFGDDGRTLRGEDPSEVAGVLADLNVAALGANCTVGPAVLQDVVADLSRGHSKPVSVQPNAGLPRRLGRQLRYAHNVEYFADAAKQFVANGATIVGGCCGTTPAHVRAIAKAVAGLKPAPRQPDRAKARALVGKTHEPPPAVTWPGEAGFTVIVGMRAPRGQDLTEFVEQAKAHSTAGADLLAITDPDPPAARVSPVAAAVLLRERVDADVILNIEIADRSLAALQADLLGAHALGLTLVVCRTGTPRVAGDYPDPGSPWDVDSVRLIGALSGLNDGMDWRGTPTPDRTRFVIGASVQTSAADQRAELDRVMDKVRAGAHFLLTDVIYNFEDARTVLGGVRDRGADIPLIATVAPFENAITVARLTREQPELSANTSGATPHDGDSGTLVDSVVTAVEKLGDLVGGVLVHAPSRPDPRMTVLVDGLNRLRAKP
jgi:homocysteine S-methyltransferase